MKFYREYKGNHDFWDKIIRNKLTAIYFSKFFFVFKNGKYHNTKNASYNGNGYKEFYLNSRHYGNQGKFTKESWRRFVKIQVFL